MRSRAVTTGPVVRTRTRTRADLRASALTRLSAIGIVLSVVLALLSACSGSPSHPDRSVAKAFLDAYAKRDAAAAGALTTDAAAATASLKRSLDGLGATARPVFTINTVTPRSKTETAVFFSASWTLPGSYAKWKYTSALLVAKTKASKAHSGWQVTWSVGDVEPDLTAGQHLVAVRVQAFRGSLDDRRGVSLFNRTPVVTVSINTARVTNAPALAQALAKALDISAAGILATIKATPKGQAAPVITLRRTAYLKVKSKIYSLPGTQFTTGTELLGPSSHFAQPLLGQVGLATKEIIDASKVVVAGDQTGLSGLQRAFNPELAGTPGVSVYAASDATGATGVKLADVLPPAPGRDITLSLDRSDQAAAEATLASVKKPAAIVMLQPSTGQVLAVANSSAATDDIALVGQFPPGSAFKIATYTAAFTANPKLSPSSKAACPGSITVNGQNVHNENNFNKGTIPLSAAFAFSCNTTAARLGLALPTTTSLRTSAAALGLGADWSSLPVSAYSGSLPAPVSPNEVAADAYGQGKVLVSPLLMAEMAGAAVTGRSVVPALVSSSRPVLGAAQPARVTDYLNTIMRDVITMPGATAHALNTLPGVIRGKTGTADFGTTNPPKAHSWFAGVRGDVAFAVFIYGGGSSVTGAVPVAKTLLTKLG